MGVHEQRLERIARLVRHPSVSSRAPGWDRSNRAVIDELATMLEGVGFRVEVLPLPDAPEKANLIATLGRGEGGLVLAGHTDTVPYDPARWQSDPFALTRRDGKLYGLGTADMKAFLALCIDAAEGIHPDSLKAPLTVLATAEEETTMDGARAILRLGRPRARHAIVGEPTDLKPVRAHKGVMMERLKLTGRTGHASDPSLGNNAIDGMLRVLEALVRYRGALADGHTNALFAVPTPTINFGRIQGGDSPNRICGACELDVDMRVLPGMDMDTMRAGLVRAAEEALAGSGLTLEVESLSPGNPPHELRATAELVRVAEELTGAAASSVAFATEAPYFAALGAETIVCGPGGIAQAHAPDEFVREDTLEPTVAMLKGAIRRLCQDSPR